MTNTNRSSLDYSKISVIDMCYFLNDRADLTSDKSYFAGLDAESFSYTEMYEYIKFKTDNFDKFKFDLFIVDLRLFTPIFDKYSENVDGEIELISENETNYDLEWHTDMKLHEYIDTLEKMNDGLLICNDRIKYFSKIAEDLYSTVCETKTTELINNNTPPPVEFSANKIIDIYDPKKVHKEFKKELNCNYDTFRAWFVDSVICGKKMSWKYDDGNKTQLRSFVYNLCGGWTPKQTNTAFNITVDSNTRDTQINDELIQRLEKCKVK